MALGGFLGTLANQVGQNIVYGQEQADRQATIDYKKAMATQMQASAAQAQAHVQASKDVQAYMQSQQQQDQATYTDPLKSAKLYDGAADIYLRTGDMDGAKEMMALAKGKRDEAAKAFEQQQTLDHQNKEAAAVDAQNFQADPSEENARKLRESAVKAGFDPTKIPTTKDGFDAWLNNVQTAGMSAKERMEFAQKKKDQDDRRAETERQHKEQAELRRLQLQQTAAIQAGNQELRRESLRFREMMAQSNAADRAERAPKTAEFNGKTYQYDPKNQVEGPRDLGDKNWVQMGEKFTAQQKSGATRALASGAELGRQAENMLQFDVGTRSSPFAGAGAHTIKDALVQTGSNSLTPAQIQMFTANGRAQAQELGNLLASSGGRSPNDSQLKELQSIITPQPGDNGWTALYKIANQKEMTLTYLEHGAAAKIYPADVKAIAAKYKDIPSTSEVLAMAKKAGYKDTAGLQSFGDRLSTIAAQAQNPGVPSAAPANASSSTGLPAGWSVKAH